MIGLFPCLSLPRIHHHGTQHNAASGICNFGMLNYYLGKRAADDGRNSWYPEIDFCKDPDAVCRRDGQYPELKWIGT